MSSFESEWEKLVSIICVLTFLDTFFIDFSHNCITIRNGGNKYSTHQKVGENACQTPIKSLHVLPHVMKAQLSRNNIIIRMFYFLIELRNREIWCYSVKSIWFVSLFFPTIHVSIYALLTKISCHHVIDPCSFPLRDVLPSAAADVEDVEESIFAFGCVKYPLQLCAHLFRSFWNENRLYPIVKLEHLIGGLLLSSHLILVQNVGGLSIVVVPHIYLIHW